MLISDILNFSLILLEIKSSIVWEPGDAETFYLLKGLINKKNGIYDSSTQRDFLLKKFAQKNSSYFDFSSHMVFLEPNEAVAIVEGNLRSLKDPVGYIFVLDESGVKNQYKFVWSETTDTDGMNVEMINPKYTRLVWTRPLNLDVSHLQKPADGKPIGKIGQRIRKYQVKVDSIIGPKFGPYGPIYITRFKDADGNILMYKGNNIGIRVGNELSLTFTILDHKTNQNTGFTINWISRPTR